MTDICSFNCNVGLLSKEVSEYPAVLSILVFAILITLRGLIPSNQYTFCILTDSNDTSVSKGFVSLKFKSPSYKRIHLYVDVSSIRFTR